jgi:lysophospholipase L1-like esterase
VKKFLINCFILTAGVIVAFLLVEIIFRASTLLSTKFSPSPSVQQSDRPAYYVQHEDSQTLQDYPYAEKKPENTFRISVVGDSYSFAPYMQFTDAFPKVLERMLSLNKTQLKAEVINHGVPAYSTSHEIEVVEKAIALRSDLILLQITLNDAEIKPYRPIGITFFDTWGSLKVTGWKKGVLDHWKSLAFVITRIHNEKTRKDYIKYFNDLFEKEKTWTHFARSVDTIINTVNKHQKKLVAVIFPLFGVPLDNRYPFLQTHQKIQNYLNSKNVDTLDLLNRFKGLPIDRMQVIPGVDRHPNEIAHRIAAEAIYDWLEQKEYIPNELRIRKKFKKRTQIVREEPF